METLPTAVAAQMIAGKKADMVYKMRYKEKSYQLFVYTFTKADLAKINRVDGKAAIYVGSFAQKGKEFDLHAKSSSLDDIKKLVKDNPIVGVLSVNKGERDDGSKKWVAVISLAYKNNNDIDKIKRESIRLYLEFGKVRDGQRKSMYKWERKNLSQFTGKTGFTKLSLEGMNRAVRAVINQFGLPADKIHINNGGTRSTRKLGSCMAIRDDITSNDPAFVVLNIHDSTIDTMLHEMAHMIVNFKFDRTKIQPHGAEFCGVFAHLLSLFYGIDEKGILSSMNAGGIKAKQFITPKKAFDFKLKLRTK